MVEKSGHPSTLPRVARVSGGGSAATRGRLTAVHPPGLELFTELEAKELIIGRETAAGVVSLADRTVSRRHLSIRWDATLSAHVASDLGSRNGSSLDGVALGTAPLANNSLLRLGDVLIVYERSGESAELGSADASRDALPGDAASARLLRAQVARAAADPSPVLLLGETGAGKERVADELHRLSGRRGKLVAVNCAALSPQLVESQLFGHRRGAFTGASEAQPGLFRAAHHGTLFLDEIGELPPEQQPKLLRALEQSEVIPVGGTDPVQVDVRVIAATNRDLTAAIESGAFRRDLYARLSLWELQVPALRERRVDVLDWIGRLHQRWIEERPGATLRPLHFSPDAAEALLLCRWPSNLRDVDRLVHGLQPYAGGEPIGLEQLPAWVRPAAPQPQEHARVPQLPRKQIPAPNREEFEAAFDRLGGRVRALARQFGRDRRQIYRWLAAYGLKGRSDPR
jgi:transcriptional regulator with GAF, ATPase, and Fis domain